MQTSQIDYRPCGERPEPYPLGYQPNPARWTGLVLTRMEDGGEADSGTPAPLPKNAITARTSTRNRFLPAERLPAGRVVVLEHVTDDPGALALHGRRIRSGDVVTSGADDPWTGSEGALYTVPMGAVLVSVETENDGTKCWRAWRVTPIGLPVMVLHEKKRPGARDHLPKLARLLDEDLREAFADILDRYRNSGASPDHVEQMAQAIDVWRFEAELGSKPRPRRRRRTTSGRARAVHTDYHCSCGNWSGAGSTPCLYTPEEAAQSRRNDDGMPDRLSSTRRGGRLGRRRDGR